MWLFGASYFTEKSKTSKNILGTTEDSDAESNGKGHLRS